MANGKPRPAFYATVFLVVLGLVALGLWRFGALPGVKGPGASAKGGGAEAPDAQGITTSKTYSYIPAQRLPEVKGVSNYKPMVNRTVRLALNVWAGWAPVIYANNGFKAGKLWKGPGGKDFSVELVLIDDPVAMRDAYAAGNVQL